jgi:hypothetical protein
MLEDRVIAQIKNGIIVDADESLLPLYLKRTKDMEGWVAGRAIDSHRTNSRLLKRVLRLRNTDDVQTALAVNAATVTDRYWFKPEGSNATYQDVRFKENYFDQLALRGDPDSFSKKPSRTPELTNIGSFEKCWKLRDGQWWMHKSATHEEAFSELFVYTLGLALGMNMAIYERGEKCVKSRDFTDGASVNFEPASAFMGDNEDYEDVVSALELLCPEAIPDYIRLIFMDTICANPDRHTNNFGLLRDIRTGKLLGLAPNYDNNMAMIARGYPSKAKANDLLIVLFNDLMESHPDYKTYIPEITEDIVRSTIAKVGMRVRTQAIVDLVMGRYALVK